MVKAHQTGGRQPGQNPKQQLSDLQQEQQAQRKKVQELKQAVSQQSPFNRAYQSQYFGSFDPTR